MHEEANKDICCGCGGETGYNEGYMIWQSFDGQYGHKWCVEEYDEQNKPRNMKIQEEIEKWERKVRHFDHEKKKCLNEIEKLKNELNLLAD